MTTNKFHNDQQNINMARVARPLSDTQREMEGLWLVNYSPVYNLLSPLIKYKNNKLICEESDYNEVCFSV